MTDLPPNFAIGTVANTPGVQQPTTTIKVQSGQGARFLAGPPATEPYNLVVRPGNEPPTPTNAEIVRVTARAGDSLTCTRQQEGTALRNIQPGDVIYHGWTKGTLEGILGGFNVDGGTVSQKPQDVAFSIDMGGVLTGSFVVFQWRRGSYATEWSKSPGNEEILKEGELGWETDERRGKIGDGHSQYKDLSYTWGTASAGITQTEAQQKFLGIELAAGQTQLKVKGHPDTLHKIPIVMSLGPPVVIEWRDIAEFASSSGGFNETEVKAFLEAEGYVRALNVPNPGIIELFCHITSSSGGEWLPAAEAIASFAIPRLPTTIYVTGNATMTPDTIAAVSASTTQTLPTAGSKQGTICGIVNAIVGGGTVTVKPPAGQKIFVGQEEVATYEVSLYGECVLFQQGSGTVGAGHWYPVARFVSLASTDARYLAAATTITAKFLEQAADARGSVEVDSLGYHIGEGGVSASGKTGLKATASNDTLELTAHGLYNGDAISLSAMTGGTPLTSGVTYFVINRAANTFKLALSIGGNAINITEDASAGTVTVKARAPDTHLERGTRTGVWKGHAFEADGNFPGTIDSTAPGLVGAAAGMFLGVSTGGPPTLKAGNEAALKVGDFTVDKQDGSLWIVTVVSPLTWVNSYTAHQYVQADLQAQSDGFRGLTFPLAGNVGATAAATEATLESGKLYLARFEAPLTISAKKITIGLVGLGSSLTAGQCFAGIYSGQAGPARAVTGTASTDTFALTAHGFYNGNAVTLASLAPATGTGLTNGTTYYVVGVTGSTPNAFQLSATPGGSAINVEADLTATITSNVGNLVGKTADQATAWAASKKVLQMNMVDEGSSNALVELPGGAGKFFWVALLANGASTMPKLTCAALPVIGSNAITDLNAALTKSEMRAGVALTAQTILPALITPSANKSTEGALFWTGVGN